MASSIADPVRLRIIGLHTRQGFLFANRDPSIPILSGVAVQAYSGPNQALACLGREIAHIMVGIQVSSERGAFNDVIGTRQPIQQGSYCAKEFWCVQQSQG
eukprot:scaffold356_cov449-Pavlova_lutheri.AAC.1